jgi:hypothetical protein
MRSLVFCYLSPCIARLRSTSSSHAYHYVLARYSTGSCTDRSDADRNGWAAYELIPAGPPLNRIPHRACPAPVRRLCSSNRRAFAVQSATVCRYHSAASRIHHRSTLLPPPSATRRRASRIPGPSTSNALQQPHAASVPHLPGERDGLWLWVWVSAQPVCRSWCAHP